MTEMLDPVTRAHVEKAADALQDEFAGTFSRETIARYIAESVDLLGESKISVFVPVLAHRFARERLKALGQAEGVDHEGAARGALRLRAQRGPEPDGGRARQAPVRRSHPRPLGRERSRRDDQPGGGRGDGRARRGHERGVPEAAHRRGRPRGRCRDHDGLWRRVPDLPGEEYEDWVLDDPAEQSLDTVRRIRDELDDRVQRLVAELLD